MAALQNTDGTTCYRNAVLQSLRRANVLTLLEYPVFTLLTRLFTAMAETPAASIDPIELNRYCGNMYKGSNNVAAFLRFICPAATIVDVYPLERIAAVLGDRVDSPPAFFAHLARVTPSRRVSTNTVPLPLEIPVCGQTYMLVAQITHIGTFAERGHFCAIILRDSRWLRYNDETVTPFTIFGPAECVIIAVYIKKRVARLPA